MGTGPAGHITGTGPAGHIMGTGPAGRREGQCQQCLSTVLICRCFGVGELYDTGSS